MSHPTSAKEKESDDFIVYGSVARYGPRTSCQRQRELLRRSLSEKNKVDLERYHTSRW